MKEGWTICGRLLFRL